MSQKCAICGKDIECECEDLVISSNLRDLILAEQINLCNNCNNDLGNINLYL